MTAAALVDQNEISSLHLEQDQLIALLKNKVDSWKIKLVRLAAIYKRLIELADPEFENDMSVSMISTYMTRLLRRHNVAIADHVSDYLPEEYKNPNLARDYLNEKGPTSWGGIDPSLLIDELLSLPLDQIEKLSPATLILLHEKNEKIEKLIESDSLKRHYALLNKYLRDRIPTPKPFKPRITKFGEAFRHLGKVMTDFGNWSDKNFPPPVELEAKYAAGIETYASIFEDIMNEKYSLTPPEWLERDVYRIHQSKHGAAVKDKVETILCKQCTKLNREKYESTDFIEMEWDWNSPSHWRCKECRGTEGVQRGLTREQCGDIAIQTCPNCKHPLNWEQGLSPIENRAIELANNLPYWYDVLEYIHEIPSKCIASRKVELGVDLSAKA